MPFDSSNPETVTATFNKWRIVAVNALTPMPGKTINPVRIVLVKYDSETGRKSGEDSDWPIYQHENLFDLAATKPAVASLVAAIKTAALAALGRTDETTWIRGFRMNSESLGEPVVFRVSWIARDPDRGGVLTGPTFALVTNDLVSLDLIDPVAQELAAGQGLVD